jgi:hypothetical protein
MDIESFSEELNKYRENIYEARDTRTWAIQTELVVR